MKWPRGGGDGGGPTLLTVIYLVTLLSNWLGRKDFPDYMPTSSGLAVALGREYSSFEGTGADSSGSQVFLKIPLRVLSWTELTRRPSIF